ncbi:hypothetical protein CYG48_05080 [Neorhizobium sp. SOG26]|nr:hypothetical protein CYG48_05080 [Neorhizobium sp. SOG26]
MGNSMPTEFDDSQHFATFKGTGAMRTGNAFDVRWSEVTLAALRAAGVLDNMVDGLSPPTTDKLWLDKNLDPAVLKAWDPVGLAWTKVSFSTALMQPSTYDPQRIAKDAFDTANHSFRANITGALPRPALNKMRDTLSALDLMTSGSLDQAIRRREATNSDASEVTAKFQEAFSECADRGWALVAPDGTYPLNSRLTAGKPLSLKGHSETGTRLQWVSGAASSGVRVAVSASPRPMVFEDLTLETFGVAAGKALDVDCSGLISGGLIMPRAESHANISRLLIKGASGYTVNGWDVGVDLISCLSCTVRDTRINGVYTGAYGSVPQASRGVRFGGDGSPTSLDIRGLWVSAVNEALETIDAEGIYLSGFEFVTVNKGITTVNTLNESVLTASSGHIAFVGTAIDIERMAEFDINTLSLYNVANPAEVIGMKIRDCARGRIAGNHFQRTGTTTIYRGIIIESGNNNTIEPNIFDVGNTGQPIEIQAGATNTDVHKQRFLNANAFPIIDAGSNSRFEEFPSYGGNLNSIYTGPGRARQVHTLVVGCTGGPADTLTGVAINTGGAIVETFSFDGNTALQTFTSPNLGLSFQRRKVSGTWGSWGPKEAENGSNANGKYTKLADGTLICTHTLNITSVVGSTVSATWTFPISAVAAPETVTTNVPSASLGSIFSSASGKTSTQATINLRRNDTAVATAVEVTMIGRWK